MNNIKIYQASESACFVEAGTTIDPIVNLKVTNLARIIKDIDGIHEVVPSYTGVMVYYDPLEIDFEKLSKKLGDISGRIKPNDQPKGLIKSVPVLYGGLNGPDIDFVASSNGVKTEDVIRIHTEPVYLVYMLGFTPGFPYLGGMDPAISTPRKGEPRLKISAGSVGIAGHQTGIYPLDSPGGWQIIGQSPLKLFNPGGSPEFLLKAGDRIKFKPIGSEEFIRICKEIENKIYKPEITEVAN